MRVVTSRGWLSPFQSRHAKHSAQGLAMNAGCRHRHWECLGPHCRREGETAGHSVQARTRHLAILPEPSPRRSHSSATSRSPPVSLGGCQETISHRGLGSGAIQACVPHPPGRAVRYQGQSRAAPLQQGISRLPPRSSGSLCFGVIL